MKKLVLFGAIIALGLTNVNAQEKGKIRVGLDLGYSGGSGGGGVLVNIEPKYNISDNMNVGLRLGAAAFARSLEGNGAEVDLDVATNGNYLATFDYYFNNGNSSLAPYLGAGLGIYSLAKANFSSAGTSATVRAENEFGGMVRGGVEIGKFRLGVEYNIVPKTDLDAGVSSKNSYLGVSLGFYVGGGKWKK